MRPHPTGTNRLYQPNTEILPDGTSKAPRLAFIAAAKAGRMFLEGAWGGEVGRGADTRTCKAPLEGKSLTRFAAA